MISKILLVVSLGLSAIFGYFYYALYIIWRDCFDETGRCFDQSTGVVYTEQSGIFWLLLLMLSLGSAAFLAWRLRQSN